MYRLFTFLFILSQTSFGQSIVEKMSPEVCECFNSKIDLNQSEETILRDFANVCVTGIMKNYENELKSFIDPNSSKSQYEQGREIGLKIYFELQNQMISSCDSFFEFIDRVKSKREVLSPENSRKQILKLTEAINSGDDTENKYYERAVVHYLSNDIKMALKDINIAIRKNKNFGAAHLLKGQLYEGQKEFKKAHRYYLKAYEITNSHESLLLVRIVERKMKSN